jgi:hypothetical protein
MDAARRLTRDTTIRVLRARPALRCLQDWCGQTINATLEDADARSHTVTTPPRFPERTALFGVQPMLRAVLPRPGLAIGVVRCTGLFVDAARLHAYAHVLIIFGSAAAGAIHLALYARLRLPLGLCKAVVHLR